MRAGTAQWWDGPARSQSDLSASTGFTRLARRFILALAAAGDRAPAIQFSGNFADGIRDVLELDPSRETLSAMEAIPAEGARNPRIDAQRGSS